MNGSETYSIYCDESCHLLRDHNDIMALGAVTAPKDKVRSIAIQIREIKTHYNCKGELKWTKVSQKNTQFYKSIIEYFLSQEFLSFRALVVKNKQDLNHEKYNMGSHDSFYYKMYFYLIRNIIEYRLRNNFEIYIDIKDTKGGKKVHELNEVLANNFYDFEKAKVKKIQQIRSHESELLQIADFLLGAITYANRGLHGNSAKIEVIRELMSLFGTNLLESTPPWETKFNIFHFVPRRET